MGTKKLSLTLLISFMNLLLEQFNEIREGIVYTPLNKLNKVSKCFDSIKNFVLTRTNSIFTIISSDGDGILVKNVDYENDHISYYIITISDSCETYQVESVDYITSPVIHLKKEFDKTRL